MTQPTDLYSILRAYANKNNSPYINIEKFVDFLETYSNRKAPEQPEWFRWTQETGLKFWSEMAGLAESGKCVLMTDTPEGRVYMPYYYEDLLAEAYRSIDDTEDTPFPGEESLRISLPEDQIRVINLSSDLAPFFEKDKKPAEDRDTQPAIIKLIFPDGYGSALILASMIPRRLMEAALLKMRYYLRNHGNREYALHKLTPQLQGKEKYLREILDQILIRPLDCLTAMESFGDFAWLFWAHFCSLVKNDIKKKKETLAEDLAAIQAAFVIEICNGFYKAQAVKQRDREIAFRSLELKMEKPPFYFTIDEIVKFSTGKGVSLIGLYTREELEAYIKKQTTESKEKELPGWLILQGKKGQRWYIKKERFLPLCAKLLIDTRPRIKKEITKRWMKLIRAFQSEAAMETDDDFDKLLTAYTAALCPPLMALLQDPKLLFVYEELERTQGVIPASSRIFKKDKLIPMNALYVIRRKDLLTDAKILLPFWYSIPILAAIIEFFKNLGKKKRQDKEIDEEILVEEEADGTESEARDIQNAAREIAAALVPQGQTLDEYLAELENRWIRLLDKQARQNLAEDVKSLVRDHLRQILRIQKKKKISREGLSEISTALISRTPALQNLGGQDSLHLYLELYMVKLLMTFKM
ncbi:MAG: hypothetical protein LBE14_01860 [Treponema sp.]|jgi:hypothetical protein|nr:hypothetical protein [Treponema sp.]